jgi:tetratricopeptide (TPR) repeat protein
MPQRPDASETAIPGIVLTILRAMSGRSQKEIAAASGLDGRTISALETGRTVLTLPRLRRLVAAMDLPLGEIGAIVRFVAERRATIARHQSAGPEAVTGAEAEGIEDFALEKGRSAEEWTRTTLGEMVEHVRVLEARRKAPALWAQLAGLAPGERRAVAREAAEFQSWALCELVCEESVRAAADDAAAALALGELAVEIARVAAVKETWKRRLEGYALAFHANALRVAGRLATAGEAFDQALAAWNSGTPAEPWPLDSTRLLDLEASLRREQGRLDLALELLEKALEVHPNGPAAARLLLNQASTLERMGDYEDAVATLRRAAEEIDPENDPRLAFILRQQLAWDLCQLGRAGEAEPVLSEARALATALGHRLDLVRLRGVEARLAAGLGRIAEAATAFREVRDRFCELGMPYDAALATVQLAVVFLEQGGYAGEVKALAAEAAGIFQDERVHAEARKALILFRQAAEEEAVTADFARGLAVYLERARREPNLPFPVAA